MYQIRDISNGTHTRTSGSEEVVGPYNPRRFSQRFSHGSDHCFSSGRMDAFSKDTFSKLPDYIKDMSKFQHTHVVPHVKKKTPNREERMISMWSIILSRKLVSISHSCPLMSDPCDVITSPHKL